MIGSLSDENHSASAQVDTIDEVDIMNLIDDRAKGHNCHNGSQRLRNKRPHQANLPDGAD